MKIAIIIPVGPGADHRQLDKAIQSVRDQTTHADPVLVCDGHDEIGFYPENAHLLKLPNPAGDFGDTPRAIGSIYAFGQGYDAVCWLDADNWLRHDHVEKCVDAHNATGKPVICSGRVVVDYEERHEPEPCVEQVPGSGFYDTNTFFVHRDARGLVAAWFGMEPDQHVVGDRVLSALATQHNLVHCHYEPTVFYRSRLAFHYAQYGWDKAQIDLETK